MTDYTPINPGHYRIFPPGFEMECIEYARHAGFCQGNAAKYIYRAGNKDVTSQELEKILWYNNDILTKGGLVVDFRSEHPDLLVKVDKSASPRAEIFYRILATDFSGAIALVRRLEAQSEVDLDSWDDFDFDESVG